MTFFGYLREPCDVLSQTSRAAWAQELVGTILSERLERLFDGQTEVQDVKGAVVRVAVRVIVEETLEGEVADGLGRGYFETGSAAGAGYRNGYRTGKLKSAEGHIEYGMPQVSFTSVDSGLTSILR